MDEARDLYGLPLEQFTEERNALVKRLRRDQRRDEAAEVAKLRKPSVSGWAVNQLARTQRREVDQLFKTGDALQKAQAELLAGRGDPGALRAAVAAERSAADDLVEKARGLLTEGGHELSEARLEQVGETLHAAALDKDARAQVQDGCLVRELRHVGLGALPTGLGAKGRERSSRKPDQARAEAKARAARVKAAEKREREARRALERAVRDVEAAEERRVRADEALRAAQTELANANDPS